jgi:hypothetical protein
MTPFLSELRRLEQENKDLMMPPMSVKVQSSLVLATLVSRLI